MHTLLFAQGEPYSTIPEDGFYKQNVLEGAKPYQYPPINRNNVQFYKRIWRDIDLSENENLIFATPGASLMSILVDAIKEGDITAFDATSTADNPTGDGFTQPMSPKQTMSRLCDSVLVPIFDDYGNQVASEMMLNDFNPLTVTKFRIKEDIFYDKQRSRIETRIIGIAPLVTIEAAGEVIGEQPAFWIYFPECRKVLATRKVENVHGGFHDMSFDDVFIQHRFRSVIIKESNPAELSIKDYVEEGGQLREAQRIEYQIRQYKKDIWRY